MTYLTFFPPEILALQEEVEKHTELCNQLNSLGLHEQDIPNKLAVVATYCNVLVDGYYTQEEIIGLCKHLIRKLQDRRIIVVQKLH